MVSMSGLVIESGTLVMRDGRIAAVGANVDTPLADPRPTRRRELAHTKLYDKFKARPLPATRGTNANP